MVDIIREYNKEYKILNELLTTKKEKQIIKRAIAKNELIWQLNTKCASYQFDKYEMAEVIINSVKPELVDAIVTNKIFTTILQAEITNLLDCNENSIDGAFDRNYRVVNEQKALEIAKCIIAKVLEI